MALPEPRDAVVISAGGRGCRWQNYTGVPKQLVKIEGWPLLTRAVELFAHARPGARISIVANDPRMAVPGAELVGPDPALFDCGFDKVTCGRSRWSAGGRTFIVWGDVWWTGTAVRRICAPGQPPLMWYGRNRDSLVTGKPWRELWGLSVLPEQRDQLVALCLAGAGLFKSHRIPRDLAWTVYQLANGQAPTAPPRDSENLLEVDDWTEDFDHPSDLDRWLAARARLWCNERESDEHTPTIREVAGTHPDG
ncbi:MAG TPA: hypothetical protein VMY40_14910 [Anaerolineae bacterium]|nr:hypothetical protein [Anaerolineae bacterium]